MSSTASSSPLHSPACSAPASPRFSEPVRCMPLMTACLFGQMVTRWSLVRLMNGFKTIQMMPPPTSTPSPPIPFSAAPTTPKPPKTPTVPATPKTPKTVAESHPCQACSWHDPKGDFEPHALATQGKIPMDRKPCGKIGTTKVSDGVGGEIWICTIHSRPCHDVCGRCTKNKHVDFAGGHGKAYLQTGFFCGEVFVEGTCEALIREGASKLAKLGYGSRMAVVD